MVILKSKRVIEMKRIWLVGVLVVGLSFAGAVDGKGLMQRNTLKELDKILEAFDEVIRKDNGQNRQVLERYQLYKAKVRKKELRIVVDENLPENIFEGMVFYPRCPGVNKPGIGISPYFITVYKRWPSIVYAALMHEIQHVYDYFNNMELFLISRENALEKYMFETDAVYMEGMFIRDFLKAQNFKLTGYESFLLFSMEQDNLSGFSSVAMGVDMDVTYDLVRISKEDRPKADKLKRVETMGSNLIEGFVIPEDAAEWKKYFMAVQLATYCQFVPQILVDIEAKENPEFDYKACKLEDYPGIRGKLDKMAELLTDYQELIDRVRAGVLEAFQV